MDPENDAPANPAPEGEQPAAQDMGEAPAQDPQPQINDDQQIPDGQPDQVPIDVDMDQMQQPDMDQFGGVDPNQVDPNQYAIDPNAAINPGFMGGQFPDMDDG